MTFLSTDSLATQIANYVTDRIVSGEYAEGEALQEQRIAADCNVSRGSVREAFLILERRFLINILPRRAARVAVLTEESLEDIFETISLIANVAVEKISSNWDMERMQIFIEINQAAKAAYESNDSKSFIAQIDRFYEHAAVALDNRYLTQIMVDCHAAIRRGLAKVSYLSQEEMAQSQLCSDGMFAAAAKGDIEQTKMYLTKYSKIQLDISIRSITEQTHLEGEEA